MKTPIYLLIFIHIGQLNCEVCCLHFKNALLECDLFEMAIKCGDPEQKIGKKTFCCSENLTNNICVSGKFEKNSEFCPTEKIMKIDLFCYRKIEGGTCLLVRFFPESCDEGFSEFNENELNVELSSQNCMGIVDEEKIKFELINF